MQVGRTLARQNVVFWCRYQQVAMSLQPVFSVRTLYFLPRDIRYPPCALYGDTRDVSLPQETHLMHKARARASVEIATNPRGSAEQLGGCPRREPDSRADVKHRTTTHLCFSH